MHGIVYSKGAGFFSKWKQNKTVLMVFSFLPVAIIQLISAGYVSNERKLIFDQFYEVLFLSRGLDQINLSSDL